MKTNEVISLLRQQRHDLMNHLQIVYGYLSMGKHDHVKNKLHHLIQQYQNERKLMNLGYDEFTLWIVQFNTMHKHIRLVYEVQIEKNDLQLDESLLISYSEQIVDIVYEYGTIEDVYEMALTISDEEDAVYLDYRITGHFSLNNDWTSHLQLSEGIVLKRVEDGIHYKVKVHQLAKPVERL